MLLAVSACGSSECDLHTWLIIIVYHWGFEEILVPSFEEHSVSTCCLTLKQVVPFLSYACAGHSLYFAGCKSEVLPPTVWMWPACYDESISCNIKFMYIIQYIDTAIILTFVEFTSNTSIMNRPLLL